jgi:hypothetical protein
MALLRLEGEGAGMCKDSYSTTYPPSACTWGDSCTLVIKSMDLVQTVWTQRGLSELNGKLYSVCGWCPAYRKCFATDSCDYSQFTCKVGVNNSHSQEKKTDSEKRRHTPRLSW